MLLRYAVLYRCIVTMLDSSSHAGSANVLPCFASALYVDPTVEPVLNA